MFQCQSAGRAAQSYINQKRVSRAFNDHSIFVVKKAGELLFDGYQYDLEEISDIWRDTSYKFGWFNQVRPQIVFSSHVFSIHFTKSLFCREKLTTVLVTV